MIQNFINHRMLFFLVALLFFLTSCGKDLVITDNTDKVVHNSTQAIEKVRSYYFELINYQSDYGSTIIATDVKCNVNNYIYVWKVDQILKKGKKEIFCPPEEIVTDYLSKKSIISSKLSHNSKSDLEPSPHSKELTAEEFNTKYSDADFRKMDLVIVKWEDLAPYFDLLSNFNIYIEELAKFIKSNKPPELGFENLEKIYKAAGSGYATVQQLNASKVEDRNIDADAFKELYLYFKKLHENRKNADSIKQIIANDGEHMENNLQRIKENIAGWDEFFLRQMKYSLNLIEIEAYSINKNKLTYLERKDFANNLLKRSVSKDKNVEIGKKTSEFIDENILLHKKLRSLVINNQLSQEDKRKETDYALRNWGEGITRSAAAIAELIYLFIKIAV